MVGGHEGCATASCWRRARRRKRRASRRARRVGGARKCPGLVVVPPRYSVPGVLGHGARIYYQYTDLVEPFGLDEAWLDLTGSLPLLGGDPRARPPRSAAASRPSWAARCPSACRGTRYSRSSAATSANPTPSRSSRRRTTDAGCGKLR
ncbi:MAG: hypothetical protein ACLTMP_03865 [Eggerthella lenta]